MPSSPTRPIAARVAPSPPYYQNPHLQHQATRHSLSPSPTTPPPSLASRPARASEHFSNFWLIILFFVIPATSFITYSNSHTEPHQLWSLIAKTIIQAGNIYLNILPLIRRGVRMATTLFVHISLLTVGVLALVGSWVLWDLGRYVLADELMFATDVVLFVAVAQFMSGAQDLHSSRKGHRGRREGRITGCEEES